MGGGLLVLALIVGLLAVKVIYGRGTPFPSVATSPILPADAAEVAIETELPPGMVSVSPDGRVFFTLHPFHRP